MEGYCNNQGTGAYLFIYHEGCQVLGQVAQRGCEISAFADKLMSILI